jgi:hypothetical protein
MLCGIVGGHGIPLEACLFCFVMGYAGGSVMLVLWVKEDARTRGLSVLLWGVALAVFNAAGALVYLCCRPEGRLARCPRCWGELLVALRRCPRCGYQPPRSGVQPGLEAEPPDALRLKGGEP